MDFSELNNMWSRQKLFNQNFVNFDTIGQDMSKKQEMTKEYALHLLSETMSVLDQINWKMHHKKDTINVSRSDLILEIIDVWKYLLSICLIWNITPEEFYTAFEEKSSLVEQRYFQEFDKLGKNVVICDIDGVLGDYPESFLEFVKSSSSEFDTTQFDKIKTSLKSLDLYNEFSSLISVEMMKEYKHRYRINGLSRKEKVISGAREFLSKLSDRGYYVVLLTSRPFDRYHSLYLDTYMWLKSNGLKFDMLINDDKKRNKILNILSTAEIKFIVDDDPKIINNLKFVNSRLYLMSKSYNESYQCNGNVVRVSSFDDILKKERIE